MALKALMLGKKLAERKKALEGLTSELEEMNKREKDLEIAISEIKTDEERETVEAEVEKFEADKKDLQERTDKVEAEIEEIESKLEEEEKEQEVPEPETNKEVERKATMTMETRDNRAMQFADRVRSVVENEDVKSFLNEVRTCIKEKRAISNIGLTIPDNLLPLLQERSVEASKLLSRVNLQTVNGTSRQTIMGDIPEAIWTEMCANLNELSLGFNNVELDGYKIGGFFAVCNAMLEDNDVQLATKILDALGKAIGKGLDKAIVYGTGVKMPLGIVTRLAQTSQPSGYPATARPWVDLHTSNILTGAGATGVALFKEIAGNVKAIFNDYFDGGLVWVMNQKTHMDLVIQSMGVDSSASIVAGIGSTMPVIGGDIVELPFMADGDIVVGYFDAYLLAQRAGTKIESSEHVRFIQDQTVFKGTARYDGTPVIAEAFEIFNIGTTAPTTSVDFPEDQANPS